MRAVDTARLRKLLALRPGEAPRLTCLLLQSLFLGIFTAFYLSTALALFLASFPISILPFAYIVSSLVGFIGVTLFTRLARRLPPTRLVILHLGTLIAASTVFWGLSLVVPHPWISFAMAVGIAPAITLLDLGFWTIAGRLFDLRQGKRLAGLISAGEVIASILGFFLIPVLLPLLRRPIHLLPIAAAGLTLCAAVVAFTGRRYRGLLAAEAAETRTTRETARRELPALLKARYFTLIALSMMLFIAAFYLIDFAFLSEVPTFFSKGSGQVAEFLGLFFGASKVCELLVKTFLSGRLLSQFGLRAGLLALPAALLGCVLLAVAAGAVSGAGSTVFFILVALAKLMWTILSRSIFDPSYRMLYQPLPPEHRLAFQTGIEGRVRQVAVFLVGIALALAAVRGAGALPLLAFLLPALGAWVFVVILLYREYRGRLLQTLSGGLGEPTERAAAADPDAAPLPPLLAVTFPSLRGALGRAAMPVPDLYADNALSGLEAAYGRAAGTQARLRLLRACQRIGSPRAHRFLASRLDFPDRAVQLQVVLSLSANRFRAEPGQEPCIKRRIEELVDFIAWDMAALLDLDGVPAAAATHRSLALDLAGKRRTLFRLLALLYDPQVIEQVQRSLAEAGGSASVYALEILDVLVSPDLKASVLPLLEGTEPAACLARLETVSPQPRLDPRGRLSALLHREPGAVGVWTKACALDALRELAEGEVGVDLIANLFHPDPLLQEEAAAAIHRIDPAAYALHARKLPPADRERLDRVAGGALSSFARASLLRARPVFARLPREILLRLAAASEERLLAAGERLEGGHQAAEPPLSVVLDGRLACPAGSHAGTGETFLAVAGAPDRAVEPARVLRIGGDRLVEIAVDHERLLPALLQLCARPPAESPALRPVTEAQRAPAAPALVVNLS